MFAKSTSIKDEDLEGTDNMPIIRTTEGHEKIPSEDTLFDSRGEGG